MIPSLERDATQFVGISLHGNERQRGSENKEAAHLNVKKKGRKKKKKRKIAFRTKRKKKFFVKAKGVEIPFIYAQLSLRWFGGRQRRKEKKGARIPVAQSMVLWKTWTTYTLYQIYKSILFYDDDVDDRIAALRSIADATRKLQTTPRFYISRRLLMWMESDLDRFFRPQKYIRFSCCVPLR